MQDFAGKKIVLGICGGIAAYKSAFLVRELIAAGAEVRVVMTASACEFITPLTFQALSGKPVRTEVFDAEAERAMGHIELARWADYLVIAPASANTIAKMAHGQADDLLSTLYLVTETPVLVCPAMNKSMWHHPATVANCEILTRRGVQIVGPEEGSQACGEYGWGRLSDIEAILTALRLQAVSPILAGKKVLITAGPTREYLDPVRYISNCSSGKMGYALAEAAHKAGAEVRVISGPVSLSLHPEIALETVESAKEMDMLVQQYLEPGMIFIGCAAVADYHVENPASEKIKKESQSSLTLNLVKNPDILTTVAASKKAAYVVGFAAETSQVIEEARKKLVSKKVDMIIANQVGKGIGFDNDCNTVTVLTRESEQTIPIQHKTRLAAELVAIIGRKMQDDAL